MSVTKTYRNFQCAVAITVLLGVSCAPGLHASSSSSCDCMQLKDCEPLTTRLLNHPLNERTIILEVVKDALCGFEGLDPLVCCPNLEESPALKILRSTRFANGFGNDNESKLKTPWIWERYPAPSFAHSVNNRFSQFGEAKALSNDDEVKLMDYRDFKTQRNCPHPFMENVYLNFDYESIDPEIHSRHHHNHRHHHHHHFHHDHFRNYNEDHDENGETHEEDDRPIIFPDDLRFQSAMEAARERDVEERATANNQTQKTAIQNSPECGISLNSRIIGGEDIQPGQFPWLTRIAYRNKTDQRISYRCSGSMINNRYLLTAAHCVINLVNDLELSHVRIGDDLSADCAPNTPNCRLPNIFGIAAVIAHPNYDQPKYANDIALLRINYFAKLNITTICLPLNITPSFADRLIGQTGVAAGWSTADMQNASLDVSRSTTSTPSTTSVKYIRLPIVNTTQCAINYAQYSENFQDPIVITPAHLCAQGQPMNDVCRGDSGGPFMDDGTSGLLSTDGRYTLLGIVAFGPTLCGITTIPGVYTRVDSYIDWIFENIRR